MIGFRKRFTRFTRLAAGLAVMLAGVASVSSFPDQKNSPGGGDSLLNHPTNFGVRAEVPFEKLKSEFNDPDMIYAPFVFWFWDEPLDSSKMGEMSRAMVRAGFNPGYAHARRSMVGTPDLPDSEWLHNAWFNAFDAALREAERCRGYLGYCDEYWWPMFQANGRVLKDHPDLAAESVRWDEFDVRGGDTVSVPEAFFAVAARRGEPIPSVKPPVVRMGRWIWHPKGTATAHSCWFRKSFDIPRAVQKALIKIAVDNEYVLFLNGRKIGEGKDWTQIGVYDVTAALTQGRNLLAVEARNVDGPYGLLAGMSALLDDGSTADVKSDSTWITSLSRTGSWKSLSAGAAGWKNAREIAAFNDPPWNFQDIDNSHVPTVILSSTLTIIGGGRPFTWRAPSDGDWRVYAFHKYKHNGLDGGKVNYLDERLAPVYIPITLEPYEQRYGVRLGRSIPGDFLDNEGDYGWKLAWSQTVERRYKERYGRDIRLWMPLMADADAEGLSAKARWEWFDLVTDVYAEAFQKITDWHERRGMYTTGHFWEEDLPLQVSADGDHMKLQRALTVPGQDCLGKKALRVHDFKEIESVAEFGRRRACTELMGAAAFEGTPWGTFNPPFLKQAANAVTAWGMSHIIPHGVFTTRKLDGNPWPPDWYTENPMFPYLKLWTDFMRRASYINSHGQAQPDVLLLNPIETAWSLVDATMLDAGTWVTDAGRRIKAVDKAYTDAMAELARERVEFLIGDRFYLKNMEVQSGKLVYDSMAFRTVILPPVDLLTIETAKKLVDFASSGGRVYALGELPTGSAEAGMHDPAMERLMVQLRGLPTFAQVPAGKFRDVLQRPAQGLESPVRFLSGAFPMVQERRRIDGRHFFWLANNTEKWHSCDIFIPSLRGAASIWDCEDGSVRAVSSNDSSGGSRLALVFRPYEAYWLVLDPEEPARGGPFERREKTKLVANFAGSWEVKYDPAIQPVMEHPSLPPSAFISGVQKDTLKDWKRWGFKKFSGLLDYTTSISLKDVKGRLKLDLGRVSHVAEVWVNSEHCGARLWGPHLFDLTGKVHKGTNKITIRVANLINNSYGDIQPSGLFGPVRIVRVLE